MVRDSRKVGCWVLLWWLLLWWALLTKKSHPEESEKVRMWKNADQKISEYGLFLRSRNGVVNTKVLNSFHLIPIPSFSLDLRKT